MDNNEVQLTDYDSNDQVVTDSANSADSEHSDSVSDSEDYNQDPGLNPKDEEMPKLLSRKEFLNLHQTQSPTYDTWKKNSETRIEV